MLGEFSSFLSMFLALRLVRRWPRPRLASVPHLRLMRIREYGAGMRRRRVLIHGPSCLGTAAAVLAAELQCRDRVFTT